MIVVVKRILELHLRAVVPKIILALLVILVGFMPNDSWSKNCRKGQPCGNSCISWDKTCRIGNTSTGSSARTVIPAAPAVSIQSSPTPARFIAPIKGPDQRTLSVTGAAFEWPDFEAPIVSHFDKGRTVTVYSTHRDWVRVSPERSFPVQWVPGSVLLPR